MTLLTPLITLTVLLALESMIFSRPSNSFAYFRWYLMPSFFTIFCWMMMLYPDYIKEHFKEVLFD